MQRLETGNNKFDITLQKSSFKIGVVLVIYTICMTVIFSVAFYLFQNYYDTTPLVSTEGAVYMLDSSDAVSIALSSSIEFQSDRVVTVEAIDTLYTNVFTDRLPYMMGILSLTVLVSTMVLWTILKSVQRKDMHRIVKKLERIEIGGQNIQLDPALSRVYDNLRQKFEDNLEVYKRLNTYLSHEQKNTLAILRSQLEIDQKTEYLKSLDVVSSGIDDILTLSENHDDTLEETVDLSLACAMVCDNYRALTGQIQFNFDEASNTVIKAKSRWIYRAISNIVDNAVKFGQGRPISVEVYSKNHTVIVCVKDEGIGIDQEKLDQIFSHRYRVGELKNDGHGIGLSLVQHVCNLCDGFVWVESHKHVGTTFYLSFKEYKGKR